VTRGQLPQRAGLLGLNGGGAAAAVPPIIPCQSTIHDHLADLSWYSKLAIKNITHISSLNNQRIVL